MHGSQVCTRGSSGSDSVPAKAKTQPAVSKQLNRVIQDPPQAPTEPRELFFSMVGRQVVAGAI